MQSTFGVHLPSCPAVAAWPFADMFRTAVVMPRLAICDAIADEFYSTFLYFSSD